MANTEMNSRLLLILGGLLNSVAPQLDQEDCRSPISVPEGGFVVSEMWDEGRRRRFEACWPFPPRMKSEERFKLRFSRVDDAEETIKSLSLTPEEAGCGYDRTCSYSLPIDSYVTFKPCSAYKVGLKVEEADLFYCQQPKEVAVTLRTQTSAPEAVRDVEFANFEDAFWEAEVRWQPPKDLWHCIDYYRVSYAEAAADARQLAPWRWRSAQTTSTSLQVRSLKRCSNYTFRIRAVAEDGTEGKARSATFRTLGCFAAALPSTSGLTKEEATRRKASNKLFTLFMLALSVKIFY